MKEKKVYTSPELTVHGSFVELTQQGGTAFVDVPQGTPAGGPGSVTGDPS
jgi:hypothetical protein